MSTRLSFERELRDCGVSVRSSPMPVDLERKIALVETMVNANREHPPARRSGSRVLFSRGRNDYAYIMIADDTLWLVFDETPLRPKRVTDESISEIVEAIEGYGSHE